MQKKIKYSYIYFFYFLLYYPWYLFLENKVTTFHQMNTRIDELIPYCKYFIIPYVLWFGYVALAYIFFYLKDNKLFCDMALFLTLGMTISMIICSVFPNGLNNFRLADSTPKDIFDYLVIFIHNHDTSTNVFPSIHVYNSIGVNYTVQKYNKFKHNRFVHIISYILCVSICLSTMFLKQHAIIDVIGAILLAKLIYNFTYEKTYINFIKNKINHNNIDNIPNL